MTTTTVHCQQNGTNSNEGNNNHNSISGPQHHGLKLVTLSVDEQYYTQTQVENIAGGSSSISSGSNGNENGIRSHNSNGFNNELTRPGSSAGSTSGPKLVNKQLVLPFVPPSFPNNSTDGANHLIKPSEYLKSITDKKSIAGSTR